MSVQARASPPQFKRVVLTIPDDAPPGRVIACYSTFDVLDKTRDIVKRSSMAHLDGTEVPLIWSHDWNSLPIGKGVIRVEQKRAIFDGSFHMQTQFSRDAWATVKAQGSLTEFSYGFDIAPGGSEMIEHEDGQPARVISKMG